MTKKTTNLERARTWWHGGFRNIKSLASLLAEERADVVREAQIATGEQMAGLLARAEKAEGMVAVLVDALREIAVMLRSSAQADPYAWIGACAEQAEDAAVDAVALAVSHDDALRAEGAAQEREACAKILELSPGEMRLKAGEMTAGEMVTARALLAWGRVAIRARSAASAKEHPK